MAAPAAAAAVPRVARWLPALTLAWTATCAAAEPLPVTKVIKLLEDMQAELEKAAKEDEDTWKSLKCWCGDNKEEKTKAVEDMRTLIDKLEQDISRAAAKQAELKTQIVQLESDIKETEKSLAEAIELRAKEAAAFHEQEVELSSGIELLKGAIVALSKHHAAMLQGKMDQQLKVLQPQLRHLIYKHLPLLGWMRNSLHKEAFLNFINARSDLLEPTLPQEHAAAALAAEGLPVAFLAEKRSSSRLPYQSYAPQSGQIFGMLNAMKESFEEDLPMIQAEEARKVKMFEELKGAKEQSLKTMRQSVVEKKEGIAEAKDALATAKNDREDTMKSLSADQKFLIEMVDRCTEGEYEWERRQKARQEEITAVAEAIAILSKDSARDGQQRVFGKSSFLQVGKQASRGSQRVRAGAAELLRSRLGAAGAARPREAALLSALKEDPFAKISQALDDLVAKLKVEQADEVKHRDFCISELHENQMDSEQKAAELEALNATALALENKAEGLAVEISDLQKDIQDMQVALQLASEIRLKENQEFVKVMRDTLAMKKALEEAYDKLGSVFAKKQSFLQAAPPPSSQNDTAPWGEITSAPEFQDYKKNDGAPHVLTLLQKLIGETKVFEDGAVHDEQGAADAYQKLVTDTNDSVKANSRLIADKKEELASTREELHAARVDVSKMAEEIEALAETKAQLEKNCNWLLEHFTGRQEARQSEIDALLEIKAMIHGMKPQ